MMPFLSLVVFGVQDCSHNPGGLCPIKRSQKRPLEISEFSPEPPSKRPSLQRPISFQPSRSPVMMPKQNNQQTLREHFLVFGRPDCGNCQKVKQQLESQALPFEFFNTDHGETPPTFYPHIGSTSLPIVYGVEYMGAGQQGLQNCINTPYQPGVRFLVFSNGGCGAFCQPLSNAGFGYVDMNSTKIPDPYPKPYIEPYQRFVFYKIRAIGNGLYALNNNRYPQTNISPTSEQSLLFVFTQPTCGMCHDYNLRTRYPNRNIVRIDITTPQGELIRNLYTQITGKKVTGTPTAFSIINGQIKPM